MKLTVIEAKTLPEAWFLCLKACLYEGVKYEITRGSFVGHQRAELDHITLRVEYPGARPLVPPTPPGVPPPTDMGYVERYLPYLFTGDKQQGEQYTYGEDIDYQLPKIIDMYRRQGFGTNQACMAIGRRESVDLADPQCLRVIDTRVRDGKLHFIVYYRSWDLWAGFPSNLAALQILKEYMASEIGVQDGEMLATSKGLHLYDYSWDLARAVINEPESRLHELDSHFRTTGGEYV